MQLNKGRNIEKLGFRNRVNEFTQFIKKLSIMFQHFQGEWLMEILHKIQKNSIWIWNWSHGTGILIHICVCVGALLFFINMPLWYPFKTGKLWITQLETALITSNWWTSCLKEQCCTDTCPMVVQEGTPSWIGLPRLFLCPLWMPCAALKSSTQG